MIVFAYPAKTRVREELANNSNKMAQIFEVSLFEWMIEVNDR